MRRSRYSHQNYPGLDEVHDQPIDDSFHAVDDQIKAVSVRSENVCVRATTDLRKPEWLRDK